MLDSCYVVVFFVIWLGITLKKALLPSPCEFTFYATSEEANFKRKFHPKIYAKILKYARDFENQEDEVYITGKKYVYRVSLRPAGYECMPWIDVEIKSKWRV